MKIIIRVLGCCCMWLLCNNPVIAQVDNSFLNQTILMNELDSNKFGFSVNVFNYLRNTEYFNKIELGRTLFGYQINPTISYQPTGNIKIVAGIFVRNDFGSNNTYTQVLPTFTVKTKYHSLEMLFGTLEGATSHQIIEPMFDIARMIENRIENGFQLKYQKPKTFFDTWINWEKFIERNDNHKEKFTAGINYTQLLNNPIQKFKIYTVFQSMVSHAGGQIDKDSINKLTMRLNYTLGLKASYEINKKQKIVLDAYVLKYKDSGDTTIFNGINDGTAFYTNLSYSYNNIQLMGSYFYGNNFYAPRGTAIYQSTSIDDPTYLTAKRKLFIPRLLYKKTLFNQLQMSARFEPIIDLDNPIFDYAYSFYLFYSFNK